MLVLIPRYCSNLFSLSSKNRKYPEMQTSITSFFKTKPPVNKEAVPPESPKAADDDLENKGALGRASKRGSPIKSSTTKRSASECATDEEDDVIQKPRSSKRLALESSPETSPMKARIPVKMDKPDEELPKQGDLGGTDKASQGTSTPAKRVSFPLMQQSPLMNPDALIKMKISSGAFALHENIGHTWFKALQGEFDKPYFKKLSEFVKTQRQSKTVFPPPDKVYTWTHYHPIRETRVVIIGQDPYHGPNQAHGLSFSVQKGVAIPKSLQNIYKELQNDIDNFKPPGHGDLTGWAKQGVLMLNACLTVNKGEANSHQGKGWENFTDAVISWISKNVNNNVVFILWGRFAQKKSSLIDKRHKILTSAHPSPFSADSGFFGCRHFSQTNAYLRSQKLAEIDWAAL